MNDGRPICDGLLRLLHGNRRRSELVPLSRPSSGVGTRLGYALGAQPSAAVNAMRSHPAPAGRRSPCCDRLVGSPAAPAARRQWSMFEDHTALVQSGVKKRIALSTRSRRSAPTPCGSSSVERDRPRSPYDKTKPSFDAADPAAYQGALNAFPASASTTTSCGALTRWASGSSGRSPATPRAGPRPARARASRPRTTRSGGRLRAVRRGRREALLRQVRRAPGRSTTSRSGTSRTTSSSSSRSRRPLDLPPAGRAGRPGDPQGRRQGGVKVFVGETAPGPARGQVDRAARVPAEVALPQQALEASPERQLQELQESRRGRHMRIIRTGRRRSCPEKGHGQHPRISRLAKHLDMAGARGRLPKHLSIYNTEFGYQSNPPDHSVSTTPSRAGKAAQREGGDPPTATGA